MKGVLILTALLLVISYSVAESNDINPKQITEATYNVTLSGSLDINGYIEYANLSLYIPQEGITDIKISGSDKWNYTIDKYDNKLLLLEWQKPSGTKNYKIEITTKITAKYFFYDEEIADLPDYLKENDQIKFTPELRELAFPYEKTFKRAAELTEFVYDHVNYDLSLVGQLKPSDWVYENKRGVCVEYANLLASLLRISGIPTRHVNGYAFSSVQNKSIGHSWIEVPTKSGSWMSFDPTWLEVGYIDATHIKTSVMDTAKQSDTLRYMGAGTITWNNIEDNVSLYNYKLENITLIRLEGKNISFGEKGYVKATITSRTKSIVYLNAVSCLKPTGGSMFEIKDDQRRYWTKDKEVYWFFDIAETGKDSTYTCPILVYDQTGGTETLYLNISGIYIPESVFISGPENVHVNENFKLIASTDKDFIFYSPELGKNENSTWDLKINRLGKYTFYLYSDGALAKKTVEISTKKEFLTALSSPRNASFESNFTVVAHVKNLLPKRNNAILKLEFDDQTINEFINLEPDEQKSINFTLIAKSVGLKQMTISVSSDTISTYTTLIQIYGNTSKAWWEKIIDDVITLILGLISRIRT